MTPAEAHSSPEKPSISDGPDVKSGQQADFAPLQTEEVPTRDRHTDPYHLDSLHAKEAFDRATEEAADGKEDVAVHEFLSASKLAEQSREWYLAALAFRRVGDFLINPRPPCDLERALECIAGQSMLINNAAWSMRPELPTRCSIFE